MTWLWREGGCACSKHSRYQGWDSNCIAGNKKVQSTGSIWTAEFTRKSKVLVACEQQNLCEQLALLYPSKCSEPFGIASTSPYCWKEHTLQWPCNSTASMFCNILHGLCHVAEQTMLLTEDILSSSRVPLDHKQGQTEQTYSLPHGS